MTKNNKKIIVTTEIASLIVLKTKSGKYALSQIVEIIEITRQAVWQNLRDKDREILFLN